MTGQHHPRRRPARADSREELMVAAVQMARVMEGFAADRTNPVSATRRAAQNAATVRGLLDEIGRLERALGRATEQLAETSRSLADTNRQAATVPGLIG